MTANLPIIFVAGTLSLAYQILRDGYRPKSKTGSKAPRRDNVVINDFQLASLTLFYRPGSNIRSIACNKTQWI